MLPVKERGGGAADATGVESRFWRDLVDKDWERRAVAYEPAPPTLWRPSPQQLFDALVLCGDDLKKTEVRHYVTRSDHTVWSLVTPTRACLPLRSDESLDGYHRRMRASLPDGDGYATFFTSAIGRDPVLWKGVGGLLRELIRTIGIPTRGFNSGVAVGDYHHRPFGVHVDRGGRP